MEKSVFKQICDDETSDSFRLSAEFKESDFDLTVLRKSNAWSTTIKQENIYLQAKQLEIETDEYIKNVQDYIRNTPKNVTLKFNNSQFIINCLLQNNIKVKYFCCKLEKVSYSDTVEMLVEKFYTERRESLERLINVSKEKDDLEKCKNNYQLKLSEFIKRKKTDDEDLLSNFVLVLNEKKKQIQHLTELLEAFRRGRPSVNPTVQVKKRSKKTKPPHQVQIDRKEVISESDSGEDYDTDDEKSKKEASTDVNISAEGSGNKSDRYAVPSTSKLDLFADDSPPRQLNLFADDSPPRHLPKRIKSDASISYNCQVNPCTSKQTFKIENQNEKSSSNTIDNTISVSFSTQELLDNL